MYLTFCKNLYLNELLETRKLDEFNLSNFKLDQTQARWFVFKENSNSIILEILEIFRPTLEKLVSKLQLELEKRKKLELTMCSNSKFWSLMKLEYDEKWVCSSASKQNSKCPIYQFLVLHSLYFSVKMKVMIWVFPEELSILHHLILTW